jgi:hypothetical protein
MTDDVGKFLGEIRAVPYAAIAREGSPEAVTAVRLEQWNGTEWVVICDLRGAY